MKYSVFNVFSIHVFIGQPAQGGPGWQGSSFAEFAGHKPSG